jgi:hypothetical protein
VAAALNAEAAAASRDETNGAGRGEDVDAAAGLVATTWDTSATHGSGLPASADADALDEPVVVVEPEPLDGPELQEATPAMAATRTR